MINNRFELIGRLTKDVEVSASRNNKKVARVTLAVDMGKDSVGNRQTTFPSVIVWEQKAEFLSRYARKGDMVKVDGRINYRSWQDQSGEYKNATDLTAEDVTILSHAEPRNQQSGNQYQPIRNNGQIAQNEPTDEWNYNFDFRDSRVTSDDLPF